MLDAPRSFSPSVQAVAVANTGWGSLPVACHVGDVAAPWRAEGAPLPLEGAQPGNERILAAGEELALRVAEPAPRLLVLRAREGPRLGRWQLPPRQEWVVHREEDAAVDPPLVQAAHVPESRVGMPAGEDEWVILFCETDRWDAWLVSANGRRIRRVGGGDHPLRDAGDVTEAWQEAWWLAAPSPRASGIVALADSHPLCGGADLSIASHVLVAAKSDLVLRGWRLRRVPGPEEACVGLLEVGMEHLHLRLATRNGATIETRKGPSLSPPGRAQNVRAVLTDASETQRERRAALLDRMDALLAALLAPPLPCADPILAYGAALDLEPVRLRLSGRSLRLCPDRAHPLCCLGLLAASWREPHLVLEAREEEEHSTSVELPFQLSPGPDRVDLTYELPAGRRLELLLHQRIGGGRRLLGEAIIPPLDQDTRLVLLVRETAQGRLSVDVHVPRRGCREVIAVPPPGEP